MGQELLTTFDTLIGELAIIPGSAAVFRVKVNDGKRNTKKKRCGKLIERLVRCGLAIIWDRKEKGRFPEVKELVSGVFILKKEFADITTRATRNN